MDIAPPAGSRFAHINDYDIPLYLFLNAYCSPFPVFLKPPVGGGRARSLPSLLAALIRDRAPMVRGPYWICSVIIRAQARKAQGPIVFLRILFFFFFLSTIRAFLGGLTWSKTLENLHTHWNPRQLGRRWGWDPGVAQRLYSAPWNTIRKLDE